MPALRPLGISVFLAFALSVSVFAQSESASVVGTVTDSSGASIPSALVSIRNTRTNAAFNVQSAQDGNFTSPPLQPGPYAVTVEAPGFTKTVQNLNLDVDQHARLDFSLKPGQLSETVTVESNAAMLDTQSSALGNVRTTQAINDLPLNGRNFVMLTYLAPGSSSSGTGYTMSRGASNQLGLQGVSVNGVRNGDNVYVFDGIHAQDNEYGAMILLPNQDAIQEFKMQNSGRDATTGRAGGGLINLVTKSGGNDFHGTAFEFFRNSALDAKNYFDAHDMPIPAFHQNQFGGSLGGRLVRDKTFFFVDIQKAYTIQGQSFLQTVPTDKERSGDFSELKSVIYNPYSTQNVNGVVTRTPFQDNRIPLSMFDKTVGQTILNLYPHQNLPGLANNFTYSPPRVLYPIQGDIRIDQHFSDNNQLFARGSNSTSGDIINPGYFPQYAGGPIFPGIYTTTGDQVVVGVTHVFSPAFLSEFRAGYSRIDNTGVNFNQGSKFMDQIGIPGIDGYGYQWQAVGVFNITGVDQVGGTGNIPFVKATNNFQYGAHLTWLHDRHTIKWGYDLYRRGMNTVQMGAPSGNFTFTGQFTQNPAKPAGTGIGLADALLGLDTGATLSVWQETGTRRWEHGMYIQDDYRVTNNLTLNLGIRYEIVTPWTEIHNRLSNLVPALGDVFPVGSPQVPQNTMYDANYANIGPRFGLSYQAASKTVVRASYGLFYDFTSESVNSLGNNNAPFAGNLLIANNTQANPSVAGSITPLSQGFLPYQPIGQFKTAGTSVSYFPRTDPDMMIQQRNVSVQQQLTSDTVLTVAYVGTRGEHLTIYPNINQPVPGPGAANPRRLFPQFGTITAIYHGSDSYYNALQVTAERRFSKGLAFLASYAWGHSVDIISTTAGGGVQNPLCRACDRGPSDFDIRHNLTLSWSYELPFGKGKWVGQNWDGVKQAVFGGWKLNSIDSFYSGSPFSVTSGTNTLGAGAGTQRADVIGDYHVANPGPSLWFNPAAFATPAQYHYGNSGRNIIVGPGTNQIDLSLFKTIPLPHEGMRLEFRTETFNLFNHPQFNNPNENGATATAAVIGIPTAGTLNYAGNPAFFQRTSREIQLAMKFYF